MISFFKIDLDFNINQNVIHMLKYCFPKDHCIEIFHKIFGNIFMLFNKNIKNIYVS